MTKGYVQVPRDTWVRVLALLEVNAREMPCVQLGLPNSDPEFCIKTLGNDVSCSCRRHWAQDLLKTAEKCGLIGEPKVD